MINYKNFLRISLFQEKNLKRTVLFISRVKPIVNCCWFLKVQYLQKLVIPYSREYLADFFGVARPSLSREFSRMSEAEIVAIEGKKITLLKKTALKYLLDGGILD